MPLILPENDVETQKLPGKDSANQLPVTKGKGKGKQVQVNKLSRSELFVVCLYLCMLSLINMPSTKKFQHRLFTLAVVTTLIPLHVSTLRTTLITLPM